VSRPTGVSSDRAGLGLSATFSSSLPILSSTLPTFPPPILLMRFLSLLPAFLPNLLPVLLSVLFPDFLSILLPVLFPNALLALLYRIPALGAAFAATPAFSLAHVILSFWSAFRIVR